MYYRYRDLISLYPELCGTTTRNYRRNRDAYNTEIDILRASGIKSISEEKCLHILLRVLNRNA